MPSWPRSAKWPTPRVTAMPHMPVLRVVALTLIRRHEEIDPLRVSRLSERIAAEKIQVNPMVCIEAPGGELVLLDGATRTESLKKLGLEHAVVQIVQPGGVGLGTWHHVVRGCSPDELAAAIEACTEIELQNGAEPPSVIANTGSTLHVVGPGLTANATLSALVGTYVGKWNVTRTTDPRPETTASSFPDWTAVVEFPTLDVEDVMRAAVTNDLLPAGITRFVVPERALRLNMPLDLLDSGATIEEKQDALNQLLEQRARDGRVRRYEEPVYVLDD